MAVLYQGYCYLKAPGDPSQSEVPASPGRTQLIPGKNPNAPSPPPPKACAVAANTDNSGASLDVRQAASSPEECCAQCDAHPGCTVGVFYENFCYLKSPYDPTKTQEANSPGRTQVIPGGVSAPAAAVNPPSSPVVGGSSIGYMTWEGCDIPAGKAGNSIDLSQVGGANTSAEECWTRCQAYNATGSGTTADEYVCTSFEQPGDWACWYHDKSALGPTAPFTPANSSTSTIHVMAHGASYVSQLGKADCFLDATQQSKSKSHQLVAQNCPNLALSTAKKFQDSGQDVFLGTINAVNSVLPVCAPQTYQTVQTDPRVGTTPTSCHYTPPGEISQCCHKPYCAPWDLHCVIPYRQHVERRALRLRLHAQHMRWRSRPLSEMQPPWL